MGKILLKLVPIFILALALALPATTHALTLSQRLKGRIVLQTEKNGEAWYIRPDNQLRVYMGRPGDAFQLMRSLGLGISNADLKKIPVGVLPGELGGRDADDDGIFDQLEELLGYDFRNRDTDGDGYSDLEELNSGNDPLRAGAKLPIDMKLTKKLYGKILLQAERNGEAWYVNPDDSKRYYLGRPSDAFFIMRTLGLGITNLDLGKIPEGRMPTEKVPEHSSYQVSPSSNIFTFDEVNTRKNVAGFRIVSWEAFNSPEPMSQDNIKVRFQGDATITGNWVLNEFVNEGYRVCMTTLTDPSRAKLPRLDVDMRKFEICFSNDAFARSQFSPLGASGTATVAISDYVYNLGAAMGPTSAFAELVSAQSKSSEQKETGVKTYTSSKLGVSFQYLASAKNPLLATGDPVIEEGDTIFVDGKEGQYVKKFSKSAQDDLKTAIQKTILSGYPKDKCHVVSYDLVKSTSVFDTAEITYESDAGIGSSGMCPGKYEHTNGVQYFLMDKN
ncbi:MAG: thrombospondin type 3 repeat-containing protein, partial [Candidatus Uhrbacteria bacterium]|nr:thrombospondin type 3 repeat-containing protein [Candidatus Uhrbacteria bacterium]